MNFLPSFTQRHDFQKYLHAIFFQCIILNFVAVTEFHISQVSILVLVDIAQTPRQSSIKIIQTVEQKIGGCVCMYIYMCVCVEREKQNSNIMLIPTLKIVSL